MIQFQILTGKMAGGSWAARHFPVRIGRGAENHLRLEDAGVWDNHLTIEFDPARGFTLQAEAEALVSVNQQPVRTQVLRPGDSIEIGSARLRFWLAEPARRGLRWSEFAAWSLIVAIIGLEVWMLSRWLD